MSLPVHVANGIVWEPVMEIEPLRLLILTSRVHPDVPYHSCCVADGSRQHFVLCTYVAGGYVSGMTARSWAVYILCVVISGVIR